MFVSVNTKILIVGDQYQAIYAFTGVDIALSLSSIPSTLHPAGLTDLTITTCRRCPKKIIAVAKLLVGDLVAEFPGAVEGDITFPENVSVANFSEGDLVLCSDNKSAVQLAFQCLRAEKRAAVSMYASFKAKLLETCDAVISKKEGASADEVLDEAERVKDLAATAARRSEDWSVWSKASAFHEELKDLIDAGEFEAAVSVRNFVRDCVFSEDSVTGMDYTDDTLVLGDRIYISTIFKAKGLGSQRVWWYTQPSSISDHAPPSVASLSVAQRNLFYVAVTRSKEKLFVIGGKPFSPFE